MVSEIIAVQIGPFHYMIAIQKIRHIVQALPSQIKAGNTATHPSILQIEQRLISIKKLAVNRSAPDHACTHTEAGLYVIIELDKKYVALKVDKSYGTTTSHDSSAARIFETSHLFIRKCYSVWMVRLAYT